MVFDEPFYICPLSQKFYDREAREIINLVEMCEGSGMGTSSRSVMALLEETNAYFNFRSIVLGEKGRIEELKRKRDKKKEG